MSIFPSTQVTRKYSTAMCYDQQQLDQVYGTSEASEGNVKLCWGFRKPTSVSAKESGTVVSILQLNQLLIGLTLSNFEYCTNCTKLFFNLFSRQILERIWDNSLCGILSSTVTVTPIYLEQWAPALGNLEMQPLRWNTRCNVNSSDPQEMHFFRRLSASNRIRFRSYWRQKSPARLQSPESAIKNIAKGTTDPGVDYFNQ